MMLALAAAGLSGGCIRLLPDPGPAPAVLALSADPDAAQAAVTAPVTVGIGLPVMQRMHATAQIVAAREDGTLAYVEGVRLAATAPISIQNVVLETLDRSAAVRASVRVDTMARGQYEVHLDVPVFQVTLPSGRRPGVARLQATARLIDSATGAPLAARVFETSAPAQRGRPEEAARGLQAATRMFASELTTWIVTATAADQVSRAAAANR